MAQKKPLIVGAGSQLQQITSEDTIATSALGIGTADNTTYLRGDGSWASPPQGSPGEGVPAGGTAGQVLTKVDGTDYNTAWATGGEGGAVGGGSDAVFYENDAVVTTDYTITSGKNAMSAGPITINPGVTVTVTGESVWSIV